MRRGWKTETIPLPEHVQRHPSVNCSVTTRSLPAKDLGGVRKIKPGLPFFLFNYSDRKIHGIFEAASNGQMNINPYEWSENGQEPTKYPAQYKPILIGNYYTKDYFWFELDDAQTRQLISVFESETFKVTQLNKRASRHDNKVGRVSEGKVTQLNKRNEAKKAQYSSKWNVLQDMNSDSDENEEEGSSSDTPFEEENEEEVVYRKLLQIVNEREKEATPFEEANEEELVYQKLLQLVNEREKANCSHSICRRSVSRWFSAVPLSGYVALVFILWVGLRFYSEE
ncbi:hypothetical protein MKX01_011040 [Papaver californicum]|nr:hypothetical protein MKX01_011040 [Papaver californicum]